MKLNAALAFALTSCLAMAGGAAAAKPAKVNLGSMTVGYTYFNKPGADVAAHDEAVKACAREALKLRYAGEGPLPGYQQAPYPNTYTGAGVAGAAIGNALADGMIISTMDYGHMGAVASGLENCMVVRGWRVVLLPEKLGMGLERLTPAALAERLAPWIGAETPNGKIVRSFGNEAAYGSNQRIATWPKHLDSAQLSYVAATGKTMKSFSSFAKEETSPGAMPPGGPPSLLSPGALGAVGESDAIIVISLTGLGVTAGPGLSLERLSEDRTGVAERIDLAPSKMAFSHKSSDTAAIVVRPGYWRIAAAGGLTFCLGAPVFEVKAGEPIYAGAFDFAAPVLGPNLSLDKPRAWMGEVPLAAKLRPAAYMNGSTGVCGGLGIYALEISGAPFSADYHWGSAVNGPVAAVMGGAQPAPDGTP